MTHLQKYLSHDGDCSCYAVIIDADDKHRDCDICDCGALRKKIRELSHCRYSTEMINRIEECWNKHLVAINR